MTLMPGFAKIWQAREIPKAANFTLASDLWSDCSVISHAPQHPLVEAVRVLVQNRMRAGAGQAGDQGFNRAVIECAIAPLQVCDLLVSVFFNGVDDIIFKGRAVITFAKLAIITKASSAACDLAKLCGAEPTAAATVKLGASSKGDAVHIKV